MKKITIFLIFLCLLFNINTMPAMAAFKLKEGFYKATDLDLSVAATHTIQNNSFSERAFLIILDSNQVIQQVIRLKPQSEKYTLVPLEVNYTVIIAGKGEVSID